MFFAPPKTVEVFSQEQYDERTRLSRRYDNQSIRSTGSSTACSQCRRQCPDCRDHYEMLRRKERARKMKMSEHKRRQSNSSDSSASTTTMHKSLTPITEHDIAKGHSTPSEASDVRDTTHILQTHPAVMNDSTSATALHKSPTLTDEQRAARGRQPHREHPTIEDAGHALHSRSPSYRSQQSHRTQASRPSQRTWHTAQTHCSNCTPRTQDSRYTNRINCSRCAHRPPKRLSTPVPWSHLRRNLGGSFRMPSVENSVASGAAVPFN
ncbi:hypothetical protein AOQ84DRAFT_36758 [Glonium stellatum]|uniref:Uncharacterized protein n=1 Tax=Glonium stellatum TaxID=574774 RepID=A0A8E2F1M3_9PEZI|nr:hypothetical protein AOQ84DRAFT_36758 [Glonium stellatum]